ncbi:hypothetical protein DNL40_00585 [Xylanimonas oleitrophica]|uniref:Phage shock protein PspC N-terminal domain-containing protein n=1 Tax=Xylanimonas oleitrophica TaxID=2607479 RepID=A0A2W5YIL5_9MICO|nr:PspC domain-containing protein [Xylanimonas oleitrophica]PZR54931.1 hypothetical protein DNL40_00585 [Xylanimonas oleitrophica]
MSAPFPPPHEPGPRPSGAYGPPPRPTGPAGDRFFDSVRRSGIARSEDRWVGGVAGGVAERLGWDPLLVRGLLIVSFFLTGAGLVAYAIGWALLPERSDGRIHLQQALRGDFDVALLGSVAVLLTGFAWGDGFASWWSTGWDWFFGIFWLAVWGTVAWLLFRYLRERHRDRQQAAHGTAAHGAAPWGAAPSGPGAPGTPGHEGGPAPEAPRPATGAPGAAAPGPAASGTSGTSGSDDPLHDDAVPAHGSAARASAPEPGRTDREPVQTAPAPGAPPVYASPYLPSGAQTGYVPRPPAGPPVPPPAPRRREIVRGPGGRTVGAVVGLVLIAGAALLAQQRTGVVLPWLGSSYDAPLTWLGVALLVVGAGIVVSGVRGRSSGWLGFFAIVGLVVTLPWGFLSGRPVTLWDGVVVVDGQPLRVATDGAAEITEGTITARSVAEAQEGYRVQFGDPTVDLSELDLTDVPLGEPVEVPVSLTAGDVTVIVPRDEAVEAEVRLMAGQVVWRLDGEERSVSRVGGGTSHLHSDEAVDGARLRLLVGAGAGNVTIEEK